MKLRLDWERAYDGPEHEIGVVVGVWGFRASERILGFGVRWLDGPYLSVYLVVGKLVVWLGPREM